MERCVIALAGNPNSGKTTLFNSLTGARQQVGNYPGITVEKREGFLKAGDITLHIVDLPGTYSLTAYSQEELVARNFLVENRPRVVVDVIDATNLERHMYLALQLMEMGAPLILALNMMDEVKKKGIFIDTKKLSSLLGCAVVPMVAKRGVGKGRLIEEIQRYCLEVMEWKPVTISYGPDLDPVIMKMVALIEKTGFLTHNYPPRWVAIKYLEEDLEIIEKGRSVDKDTSARLEKMVEKVSKHCETTLNTNPEAIIADYRYGFISSLLKGIIKRERLDDRIDISDKIDKVLTHRLLGPIIMVGVLYLMFKFTFVFGDYPLRLIEDLFSWLANLATQYLPPGTFRSLIVSGIIDGVGGVLSFVPLIMIMFFILAFLEDSGYMARMAYMLDRILRVFGLHGYSVMPFILSGGIPGGCAVPGIMATRTLRSPKEKLATLLTAPFFSCGAKVPVFLLLAAAFFPKSGDRVLFGLTLFSWICALIVAKFLRTTLIKGPSTPFVMELPPYRLPTIKGLFIHTWERVYQYIKKAGTVILAISILIWAAMTFPSPPKQLISPLKTQKVMLEQTLKKPLSPENRTQILSRIRDITAREKQLTLEYSLAGRLGRSLEGITELAGFDWKTNIALIGGFAAKEVIVSTLGTIYSLRDTSGEKGMSLSRRIQADPQWNKLKGLSIMVFVLLYSPCFISVITMIQESNWRWGLFSIVFNTLFAFFISTMIYQFGHALF